MAGLVIFGAWRRLGPFLWLFVHGAIAANIRHGSSHLQQAPPKQILGHVVSDSEPIVLDFSNEPFADSIISFTNSDPYKTNPKNGTPWFRYTKTAGRGQANHSHFGGLSASGDFPEDILHAHNVVRERAGVPPLRWSSRLAEMSSARVLKLANEGCYIEHSPLKDRWYEAGFEYIGENLYKVINMKPTGVDIVDAWYAEIEDYSYGTVGSPCVKQRCAGRASPPCTLGHFTQVMWGRSTDVGCARAECPGQAKRTFVSVCNYGPGGNIVGHYPFPALSSGKMGLSMQDCRIEPKPERSAWDKVKHGEMPSMHHSRSGRIPCPVIAIALFLAMLSCAADLSS